MNNNETEKFYDSQLECWKDFRERTEQLGSLQTKTFVFGNFSITIQHNPARAVSSFAKVDPKSISRRKCFLCESNRPEEQKAIDLNENFCLLVNPFPILDHHFTIPLKKHQKQNLLTHFNDFMEIAKKMVGYNIFYNGPTCGASAPDHMHFQAVKKGQMPFEKEYRTCDKHILSKEKDGVIFDLQNYGRKCIVAQTDKEITLSNFFKEICDALPSSQSLEPMMNVFLFWEEKKFNLFVFPRKRHRPVQYDKETLMVSPGAIDMGGIMVLPRAEDFQKMDADTILNIYNQVSL